MKSLKTEGKKLHNGRLFVFVHRPSADLLLERSNQGFDEITFWNIVELQLQKTFSEEAQVRKKECYYASLPTLFSWIWCKCDLACLWKQMHLTSASKKTIQSQSKYHHCFKAIYHPAFTSIHMPLYFEATWTSKSSLKHALFCRLAYF